MKANELKVGECYRCRNKIMVCKDVRKKEQNFPIVSSHTHVISCELIAVHNIGIRYEREYDFWADMNDDFEPFPRKRFDQILALHKQFHAAATALINEK